jgi:hypothetical protein
MKKTVFALVLAVTAGLSATSALAAPAEEEAPVLISAPADSPVLISAPIYTDVAGTWFEDAANEFGYADIFSDGSGKFNPDKKITRMEFVRLFDKALNININYLVAPDIKDYFSDVNADDPGASELIDLVTAGIIEKGGTFNPGKQLERDEMIHYLIKGLDYVTGGDYAMIMMMPAPFNDDAKIDEAYKNDVYKAVILKLIYGYDNNILRPDQGATRAEAAVSVSRLVSLLQSYVVDVLPAVSYEDGALKMSLTIQNNSDQTITINHTSGQKYDFKLFDKNGENLYTWSADKMFIAALSTTEIKAGEKIEFSDTLDSDAFSAIQKEFDHMSAYIVGSSEDFPINPEGYIAYPDIPLR